LLGGALMYRGAPRQQHQAVLRGRLPVAHKAARYLLIREGAAGPASVVPRSELFQKSRGRMITVLADPGVAVGAAEKSG
jgi:hypothetical protein